MRAELKEWLWLAAKTLAMVFGGILVLAALVDLVVDGFSWETAGVLAIGLAVAIPPLAFAFRDAVGEAKKGRI